MLPSRRGAALDDERLALEVRTVVVSYVAALRRLSFVEHERDVWIDHARQHALGLIDKIGERASAGTGLPEAQLATIAHGRAMIDEAAAEALEGSARAEQ